MTESFDGAMAFARAIVADCDAPILDRLQRAHEHEMEQLRRLRFREGYEAGQRSMDAEHYAVALRLKHLPLDEDSHGNLSQIARAVWHSDFGWTRGACEALRDELVRLLGGVHDDPAPTAATCGACDADCDCHNQQPKAVAHDVLGNERHKAVCELRNARDSMSDNFADNVSRIMYAIDARPKVCERACEAIADRLIHLLGGDEPAESLIETLVKNTEELSRQGKVRFPPNADGSLDSLKTVEETAALIDEVKMRADQSHESSPMRQENETGITDELRKWASTEVPYKYGHQLHAIADRIDAQFKRICWQQEAVLQHTIDTMVDERDELQRERDELRTELEDTRAALRLQFIADREAVRRIGALHG